MIGVCGHQVLWYKSVKSNFTLPLVSFLSLTLNW